MALEKSKKSSARSKKHKMGLAETPGLKSQSSKTTTPRINSSRIKVKGDMV